MCWFSPQTAAMIWLGLSKGRSLELLPVGGCRGPVAGTISVLGQAQHEETGSRSRAAGLELAPKRDAGATGSRFTRYATMHSGEVFMVHPSNGICLLFFSHLHWHYDVWGERLAGQCHYHHILSRERATGISNPCCYAP